MTRVSRRVSRIQQSAAIVVSQLARELKAAGRDVIGLGVGEPDFDTPDGIKDAAVAAIRAGQTKYTTVDGVPELKAAISEKLKRDNGLTYGPERISAGAGGKQIISNALAATLDPDDEVLVPAPYWMSYPDMVEIWDGRPVILVCPQAHEFKLSPEELDAAIGPRTRWLILNSPSNPTGAAYTADELRALAEVVRPHPDLMVMCDDIYEQIVFDGFSFVTLANVAPDLDDRILIVNGVSKSYSMTGWRLGYGAGSRDLIRAMAKIQGQTTTHPSSISQAAAVEALRGSQDTLAEWREVFQRRRDLVVSMLNECRGLSCRTPEGAFYVYPSCAGTIGKKTKDGRVIETDENFATALLDREGVAVVHGAAFGLSPHFRLSFAASEDVLTEACRRIDRFCAGLR